MARKACLSLLIGLLLAAPLSAQGATPWRYRWQKGEVLTYRVEHITAVAEVANTGKVETRSRLSLVKRWQVAEVDGDGVATLHLSLAAMRHEQTRPNGETLLFDSADLDKSTPELREQLGKFVGQTLAVLRIDGQGRVLEVRKGSAAGYESEPPFPLILPAEAPSETGQFWERNYHITLDPPHGTGEKHAAVQKYQVARLGDGTATVTLSTRCTDLPASPADQIPLLQKQPDGQIVFDIRTGRIRNVQLLIDRIVQNHQGEGSSYRFQSSYREELVESR